jgi:hypothetical protein
MENEFAEVMSNLSDEDLINVLESPSGDYQPVALEAAKKEFAKRNLSQQHLSIIKQETERNRKEIEFKANLQLPLSLKIAAFILPGILQIIIAGNFKADGYDRKFDQFVSWSYLGYLFYGLIAVIIVISQYL